MVGMTPWMSRAIRYIAAVLLWSFSISVGHAGEVERFQEARAAYQSKNLAVLAMQAEALRQQQSPLLPNLLYWQMILTQEQLDDAQLQTFIEQYGDSLLAQRVRELWLKRYGKTQQWEAFQSLRKQMPAYYVLNDTANVCYQHQAAIALDDPEAYETAKRFLLTGKELPADCNGLLDQLQQVGVLDERLVLQLYREALLNNKPNLARAWLKRSGRSDSALLKQLDATVQNPANLLKKAGGVSPNAYGKALWLYAIARQARADTALAYDNLKKLQAHFNTEEKHMAYAALALESARKHEPEASLWFKKANDKSLSDLQWEWYARSQLRQQDWAGLLAVIQAMPAPLAEEATWRYWKARALKEAGQLPEANALLAPLSRERSYYGWLAAEELGPSLSEPEALYQPQEDEVKAFAKQNALRRVDALLQADARYEARLEWLYQIEGWDDQSRILAAQYALRKQWFDLAVLAADKTSRVHNFDLRYPTPYRDYLQKAAQQRDIDEAWVYGIIRQESRFMHYAKSSVGAGGLMQVMPATAKWIAKKLNWSGYHEGLLHDIDTNVNLGTFYMRYTLDTFAGQEVMATAAYNAGPSRARKWAAALPLEGAIYVETIPFAETRNYVKKVLANAHMYAPRLGLPPVTLKKRLGIIPPRTTTDSLPVEAAVDETS